MKIKYCHFFWLIIIFPAISCTFSEIIRNDLAESCLRGKVRSVSRRIYTKAIRTDAGFIPDTGSRAILVRVSEYNTDGNLTSIFKVLKKDSPGNFTEMLRISNHRKDTGIRIKDFVYYGK